MNDKKIIGFRFDATGVFGYEFYHDNEKLCSFSTIVVPDPTVMINGYGRGWESDSVRGVICPGEKRHIVDRDTGKQAAVITYIESGCYVVNNLVIVKCHPKIYEFIRTGETIAEIKRFEGKTEWKPDNLYLDYTVYFEVVLTEELDDEWKLLIMAFPMLKFG